MPDDRRRRRGRPSKHWHDAFFWNCPKKATQQEGVEECRGDLCPEVGQYKLLKSKIILAIVCPIEKGRKVANFNKGMG